MSLVLTWVLGAHFFTEGWDRQVQFVREEAKKIKQEINTVWIYPPVADHEAVFAIANPDFVIVP